MLQLKLFGGFSLWGPDGRQIDIGLAKPRALLGYLALNAGRAIDRGQLATLLWGTQPDDRARHSLTQALSSLSGALGEQAAILERNRRQVSLQPDEIAVDVLQLRDESKDLDRTQLGAAIEQFEHDVLAEFSFDEPGFDEWALMTREELAEQVLRAGVMYLSLEESERDIEGSLSIARKLLRIDPYFEPAHRALIDRHLTNGDMGAAKQQAQSCETVLREELGVEPGPETRSLIERIGLRSPEMAPAEQPSAPSREPARQSPSIVVLALQNLTGDPSLHSFCQGLSDDITTELVRHRSLFVISQESAFQMSSEPEGTGQLCRRLGVRHALCGSLRRLRDQFRVNLRLIEGSSGQTIWSEKYDMQLKEILEVSDEVTESLVGRLSVSLEEDALTRARRTPLVEWSAYDHLLQGLVFHHRSWYGTGTLYGAIKHFKRAVELDPELARAHAYLACAISAPWYKDREVGSLDRCIEHATRAVEIDPFEAEAQRIMGGVYLVRGQHELADHHFDLAMRAHPGNAHVLAHAAKYRTYVGDPLDAVSLVNKARQLNPLHPAWYWQHLGVAMFDQKEYQKAIQMFSRLPFLVFFDRLYLAAAQAHLGNDTAAEYQLGVALRDRSELNRESVVKFLPYKSSEQLANVVDGLVRAGLTP